jgi:hypothetical protein
MPGEGVAGSGCQSHVDFFQGSQDFTVKYCQLANLEVLLGWIRFGVGFGQVGILRGYLVYVLLDIVVTNSEEDISQGVLGRGFWEDLR